MKRYLLFCFLLICFNGLPQEFNPKVISLTENPINSEFQFLKEELKNAQVVLLGENTHFDGNVFEYRNRVIKYLVEELGFTTISFESGVYDLYKVNKEIQKGESIRYALQNGLMGHWSKAKEFHMLFNLIENHKLKLYGFDSQVQSSYARKFFINDFKKFLSKRKIKTTVDKPFIEELKSVVFGYKFNTKLYDYNKFQDKISSILQEIIPKTKQEEFMYWSRIIKGCSKVAEDVFKIPEEPITPFVLGEADKIRDKQMAKNLLMYIKNNPEEKVICLGANAHFINDLSKVKEPLLSSVRPMGSYLKEQLKDKLYTLAFITSCVKKTAPNSVEDYINKKNKDHLFFSTHQKEFEKPLLHCFVSDGKFIKSRIDNFFDGCITFKKCEGYEQSEVFDSSIKTTYEIKGKLIDKNTQKPLTFALVSIPNSSIETFSDKNGNYKLIVPKDIPVSKLKITNIGYEDILVDFKPILKLSFTEKINVLEEVVVNSVKTGKTIVEKAIKRKWKNHLHKKVFFDRNCKVVYKEEDSVYLQFGFTAPDLNRPNFKYRKTKGINLSYDKGLVDKDSIINMPFYRTAFYFPVLEKNNISKYKFSYEKDTIIRNEKAYKVTFSTIEDKSTNTLADCSGAIYISKSTDAFLKIEHEHKWDTEEHNTEKLAKYWYVPIDKRRKKNITYWQTTFDFEKDTASNMYLYNKIITEWLGYYMNSKSEKVKLYTKQKSRFIKRRK